MALIHNLLLIESNRFESTHINMDLHLTVGIQQLTAWRQIVSPEGGR